jgi:hypothetical protein
LKLDTHRVQASSVGTNYMQEKVHQSSAETPGVLSTSMKWENGQMIEFEVRDWYTNAEAGFRDKYPFVQKDLPVGAIFLGTEGKMIIPDYSSYYTFLGRNRDEGPSAFEEGSPISTCPIFAIGCSRYAHAGAMTCRLKSSRARCLRRSATWRISPTESIAP